MLSAGGKPFVGAPVPENDVAPRAERYPVEIYPALLACSHCAFLKATKGGRRQPVERGLASRERRAPPCGLQQHGGGCRLLGPRADAGSAITASSGNGVDL